MTVTITATAIAAVFAFGGAVGGTVVVGAIVVVVLTVVVTVVVGTIFWKIPTIGSFGTTNDTVHAVAFTENGVIAVQVPLTSSKGFISEGLMPQEYGNVTFAETFAAGVTLMLNALIDV
jgi:hypothetical protein